MGIEVWIDQVSTGQQDMRVINHSFPSIMTFTYNPFLHRLTSWLAPTDDNKENILTVPSQLNQKHHLSVTMDGGFEDVNVTPRPAKKRRHSLENIEPPEHFSSISAQSEDAASEELESHRSGRLSPSKQLAYLEDRDEPVIFCDFQSTQAEMLEDVQELRRRVQRLSDGVGILGYPVRWHHGSVGTSDVKTLPAGGRTRKLDEL